ncbi:MAG: elongation factor P maturation arginine rhamnosyltransferase EarP [Neisseria sp.]|nr:elongation factor P maturation arginine rhamnosyltransferase EarP [Neisseria sp.]
MMSTLFFPDTAERPLAGKVCWLFCTVIDNFGDIGVCWRLAQMLRTEQDCRVYLWLDDAASLAALSPGLPTLPCSHQGIEIRLWEEGKTADLDGAPPPDLLLETFACTLPDSVLTLVRHRRPLWINWEYLSAENWAEAMHGKPSLQADGCEKYFWLMGFSEHSGGLLRERDFANRLTHAEAFGKRLLRDMPSATASETVQSWLLFGYESGIWADWLSMWQAAGRPIRLLLAGGKIIGSLKKSGVLPHEALLADGCVWKCGCVELLRLPFVAQDDFDRLLACADGLIVRGEDSFVRAQFSGKPFLWHIYPQEESVHLEKLAAFWQKTETCFPKEIFTAQQALSDELNGRTKLMPSARLAAWQTLQNRFTDWQEAAQKWRQYLSLQESAVEKLAKFCIGKLK